MQHEPITLESLLALRDEKLDETRAALRLDEGERAPNVSYEKLRGVTRLHNGAAHPGHFYVGDDGLAMLYVGDREALASIAPPELMRELGGEGMELRSRAGKRSVMHLYPEKGVAFSAEDDRIDFIEIFPPTTRERYLADIYSDPGPFTR